MAARERTEGNDVITEKGIAERIARLHELSLGLSRELSLMGEGNDPLLRLERVAYLDALRDALAGVEASRVVLARARQRMATDARVRPNHVVEGSNHEAA
jgi:hypothetical protein